MSRGDLISVLHESPLYVEAFKHTSDDISNCDCSRLIFPTNKCIVLQVEISKFDIQVVLDDGSVGWIMLADVLMEKNDE